MTYAIISLGGKQYRVQEGERLLVDRLPHAESKTFHPQILFTGGNGAAELAPKDVQVTVRVLRHVLGEKIRIGKYRPKSGYRRHNGFRSRLSQIEIESIGKKGASRAAQPKAETAATEEKPKAAAKPRATAASKAGAATAAKSRTTAAKPKAAAEDKPPAEKKPAPRRKPAANKTEQS